MSPMGIRKSPWEFYEQDSTSLTRLKTTQKSAPFRAGHSFVPYPPHYRAALAFSAILYPRLPQSSLRLTCPDGRRFGLTVFHCSNTSGLDPAIPPAAYVLAYPQTAKGHPAAHLLVQAYQQLWLVFDNGVY